MDIDKDYLGIVVCNEDPTFSGRCKVSVFGLFEDLDDEFIPWFTPQSSCVFSSNKGAGSLSVPKMGSVVRVRFPFDNIYCGEYSNLQTIDPALVNEIQSDYQNTHVLLYDSEKNLAVLYQPMTGFKIYLNGSFIKVDSDNSIQLKHANNSNMIEINSDKINIVTASGEGTNLTGEINITSGARVNVVAPTVNIDAKAVTLGKNAAAKAVKGEKLIGVLKQIATELDSKFPQGASTLKGRSFDEILSTAVTLE